MIDANGNIKVGGDNCVVSDFMCSDWNPCRYCKTERERLFEQRLARRQNLVAAEAAAARARSNAALAEVIVENPGVALGVLGLFGAVALGVGVADKYSKSKGRK